jgi:hypothetical protein
MCVTRASSARASSSSVVLVVFLLGALASVCTGCTRKPPVAPTPRPAAWEEPQQTQRADEKKAIDSATSGGLGR